MVRRVCGWQRGAYPILHEALGIRQTDQSCHHEVGSTWILWSGAAVGHITKDERRLLLKERSVPYRYSKQKDHSGEDASDHSLP